MSSPPRPIARPIRAAIVVALAIAGCAPVTPSPTPGAPATAAPSATAAPVAPTPVPQGPSPSGTPAATARPEALGAFDVAISPVDGGQPLALRVLDYAGTLQGAEPAPPNAPRPEPDGPFALAVGRGPDDHSLTVAWIGGPCDERAQLELASDGRTLALRFPPEPGCDAIAVGFAVTLRFADPIDPAGFAGRSTRDLFGAGDLAQPTQVAFVDALHGFVAGSSGDGDTLVLETHDGGATWEVGGFGRGEVTALAVAGDGAVWAGRGCVEAPATCQPGTFRRDGDDGWTWVDTAWPVGLTFAGPDGAGLFLDADSPRLGSGLPVAQLRVTVGEDGDWRAVDSRCTLVTTVGQAVAAVDARTLVVLCEDEPGAGSARKDMFRSEDRGASWARVGDGPYAGYGMALDLAPDGTGWLWGDRTPLLATTDAGGTWTPLDVADGEARIAQGADAWGGGAGVALVWEPEREATLLLQTRDGTGWTELAAFPRQSR